MERGTWMGKTVRKMPAPVPLVELADDRRVLIEHHHGVSSYAAEQVSVRVRYGQICIRGRKLCIARMSRDQLVICGQIEGIELIKTGGNHGR